MRGHGSRMARGDTPTSSPESSRDTAYPASRSLTSVRCGSLNGTSDRTMYSLSYRFQAISWRLVNSMVAHGLTTTLDRLLSAERTVVYANDRSVASVASEAKRIFMPLLELIQVYSTQDCQTLCMSKQKGSALIISGARHSREQWRSFISSSCIRRTHSASRASMAANAHLPQMTPFTWEPQELGRHRISV